LSPDINLDTHISDIVALFECRDLQDVILVGHSYGGTVITAVAERVADRIRQMVYLDASVPRDGESNYDVIGPTMAAQLRASAVAEGDGWKVPPAPYVLRRPSEHPLQYWVAARLKPHPLRPFAEPARLSSSQAAALPRAFIQTTQSDLYSRLIARGGLALSRDQRRPLCHDYGTKGAGGYAERASCISGCRVDTTNDPF
jgi:pimeloyl-ACP methyl ester carboxylesterase